MVTRRTDTEKQETRNLKSESPDSNRIQTELSGESGTVLTRSLTLSLVDPCCLTQNFYQ